MYCPSCGKTIPDSSAFCMHCGRTTGLVAVEQQAPPRPVFPPGAPLCPNCGQIDSAQNVMGIIAAGTSSGTAPTTQVGQLGGHVISSTVYRETHSSTLLAQTFTDALDWDKRSSAAIRQMRPEPPYAEKEAHLFWTAERRFRTGLFTTRFLKVHYCARCTGVFVPGEGDFAPLTNMDPVLYKPPTPSEYDVCEVQAGYLPGGMKPLMFLVAQAFGRQGFYVAKVLKWQEGVFKKHRNPPALRNSKDSRGVPLVFPSEDCRECLSGREQMVRELISEGWERTDEPAEQWWQVWFRRPAQQ
jgi:hypothetical protein